VCVTFKPKKLKKKPEKGSKLFLTEIAHMMTCSCFYAKTYTYLFRSMNKPYNTNIALIHNQILFLIKYSKKCIKAMLNYTL